jgi:hypothetical protein
MVEDMNVSQIPQTPEHLIIGVGAIFGIGIFCLIIWAIYKAWGS